MVLIDKTDPDAYTTDFLLLMCQLIYDNGFQDLNKRNANSLAKTLKTHPFLLQNSTEEELSQWLSGEVILKLFNNLLMRENIEKDVTTIKKNAPHGSHTHPGYVTAICDLLYARRLEEIEASIDNNKVQFSEQLAKLKSLSN
ncbi:unnamed protein product [[Candida] boidinii]|uniref:Unnamed protein product n=1 Tax=Candida boidinii TaxID=5477 RepID=A0A9W6W834_CANBO|nr:unnamed protein product [[Candida] boidinii]GMF16636.1 unnamed protein product [[Candida] boidinii]GMG18795.1 unnamed protein product [[Candida] boidinii]